MWLFFQTGDVGERSLLHRLVVTTLDTMMGYVGWCDASLISANDNLLIQVAYMYSLMWVKCLMLVCPTMFYLFICRVAPDACFPKGVAFRSNFGLPQIITIVTVLYVTVSNYSTFHILVKTYANIFYLLAQTFLLVSDVIACFVELLYQSLGFLNFLNFPLI